MSESKKSTDSSLEIYFREISKYPILPPDEIDKLVIKAQKGDKVAREKVVLSLLRLVVSIAIKYRDMGVPLQDLINEGNLGLLRAIEKFDPSKKVHFIGYAPYWIKQAITRALDEQSSTVRIPSEHRTAIRKIKKAEEILKGEKEITVEEIAKITGLTENEVRFAYSIWTKEFSLDQMETREEDKTSWEETLEQKSLPSPEVTFIEEKRRRKIKKLIDSLSLREKIIIYLYTIHDLSCKEILDIVKKYKDEFKYDVNVEKIIIDTLSSICRETMDITSKLNKIADKFLSILQTKEEDIELWKEMGKNKGLIENIFSSKDTVKEAVLFHRFWKYIEEDTQNRKIFMKWIKEKLKREEERKVFLLYYALDSGYTHTLEFIGYILSISRERVRQVKEQTMRKLRSKILKEKIV